MKKLKRINILSKEKKLKDIEIDQINKINKKEFMKDHKKEKKETNKLIGTIKNKKWYSIFKKEEETLPFYEATQPLLFLIRSSNNIDVFENVKDGVFNIEGDEKGKKTGSEEETQPKSIILQNSKLLNLPYGVDEKTGLQYQIKLWIASEDEAVSYPNNPIHDSSVLCSFITRLYINAGLLLDEGKKNTKALMWLKIGLGLALAIYLAYKFGVFDNLGNAATTVTPAVKETLKNVTANNIIQNVR